MAKSPSHGRDMGEFYLIFWLRNYPHDRGTRPLIARYEWQRRFPALRETLALVQDLRE